MASAVFIPPEGGGDGGVAAAPFVSTAVQRHGFSTNFRKLPRLAATMDPAAFSTQALIREYTRGSDDFQLAGTNAVDSACIGAATGGFTIATAGANGDQMIVSPLVINGNYNSGWGWTELTPERQASFEASVSFLTSVSNMRVYVGLKLTNAFDLTTDADHALFVFDTTAYGSSWRTHSRVNTVDEVGVVTGLAKASPQLQTRYALGIYIDGNRRPQYSIDGQVVLQGPALTGSAAFRPFIAVQTLTASVKQIGVQRCGVGINI